MNCVVADFHGSYCPIVLCWVRILCSESSLVVPEGVKAADVVGTANSAVLKGGWEARCSGAYPVPIMIRQSEIPITGPVYTSSGAAGDEWRSEKV